MKKLLAILLVLVMGFSFVACSTAAPEADAPDAEAPAGDAAETTDEAVTLVYAEVNPLDSIVGQTATYFAEQVSELSGGTVTLDIQANGVLGSESVVLDGILGGSDAVDMSRISAFALTTYGGQKSVLLSLPFTFVSRDHFWNFANSDLAPEFLNEPQELGLPIRGIFYGEEGFRHFFTTTELSGMEDLQGLKLRVSNDPIMNGLVEGLGAIPTVLDYNELYSGLESGIVDGAEQPVANYKSKAFFEPAPNMILNGHTLGAIQVVISDNAWNKLSENQQNAIMEAGAMAQEFNANLSEEAEMQAIEDLRADGVNVIDVPDKTPWIEATADVIEANVSDDMQALYDEILAMQ